MAYNGGGSRLQFTLLDTNGSTVLFNTAMIVSSKIRNTPVYYFLSHNAVTTIETNQIVALNSIAIG